jgi:hypothetical protein
MEAKSCTPVESSEAKWKEMCCLPFGSPAARSVGVGETEQSVQEEEGAEWSSMAAGRTAAAPSRRAAGSPPLGFGAPRVGWKPVD